MSKLDKQYIALAKKIERMEGLGQRALANNYKKLLGDLRKTIGRLYESYEIDGQLTFDEMAKYNRLAKLDKDVERVVTTLYRANGKAIRGTLTGVVTDTYKGSIGIVDGYANQKVKGIMKPFDVTATVNREMAGLKWTQRIAKQRVDLIYDIQKEIKLGLTQGDTYGDMAGRLLHAVGNDKNKSNIIIRTEAHRCKAESRQQSFNDIAKAGIEFKKKWVSGKDERVRSAHNELDGTIINQDEDFISPNGGVGYGPGQMNNASDDINCRCILTLVIE